MDFIIDIICITKIMEKLSISIVKINILDPVEEL